MKKAWFAPKRTNQVNFDLQGKALHANSSLKGRWWSLHHWAHPVRYCGGGRKILIYRTVFRTRQSPPLWGGCPRRGRERCGRMFRFFSNLRRIRTACTPLPSRLAPCHLPQRGRLLSDQSKYDYHRTKKAYAYRAEQSSDHSGDKLKISIILQSRGVSGHCPQSRI